MRKDHTTPSEQDSINFAVHPFSLPNQRLAKATGEIYFEEALKDRRGNLVLDENNRPIISKWRVSATAEEGDEGVLPYGDDQKTLVVSGYLVLKNGDLDTGDFHFSSANFLRLVGKDPQDGRSYEWLRNSFTRLRRAVLRAEYIFYNPEIGEYIRTLKDSNLISYIELYSLADRRKRIGKQLPLPMNRAILGKPLLNDLRNNLSVTFDIEFFRSLKYPLSESIYRFFNVSFEEIQDNNYCFKEDLFFWASRLGISATQYPSYIQRVLWNAHQELKEKGYLAGEPVIEKDMDSRYYIIYTLNRRAKHRPLDPNLYSPLTQELVKRGVNLTTCLRMMRTWPESRIREKIEYFDFERRRQGESIRSAWLVKAIEENYTAPEGFASKAEREKQARQAQEKKQQKEAKEKEALEQEHRKYTQRRAESPWKDLWEQMATELRGMLSPEVFSSWIEPTWIADVKEDVVALSVPNAFFARWIEEHYLASVEGVLSRIRGQPTKLRFRCDDVTGQGDAGGTSEGTGISPDGRGNNMSVP